MLAYSTVSQLGYMFLALGVGAFAAGVFHVFTHAFFKALLFLGSGSVIHAMSGEQDMRNMGDLRAKIPTTYWTMFVATLAIAGIPALRRFLLEGRNSLADVDPRRRTYRLLWGIGFLTALMTAFYMFRLIYLTFYSKPRMSHEVEHHIHESPASMTIPLVVLAVMAVITGFLGFPQSLARLVGIHGQTNRIEAFLNPVFSRGEAQVLSEEGKAGQVAAGQREEEHTNSAEYLLMFLSVAAAGVGWLMAGRAYRNADKGYVEPIATAAPPVYNTLLNKYYVDEGYDYVVTGRRKLGGVRLGTMGLGEASSWFDSHVVDGAVNAAGWLTRATASFSSWWDKWIIDGIGVNGPAILARMLSYPARLFEWGLVQWYALVMTAGLVGFVFYYVYH